MGEVGQLKGVAISDEDDSSDDEKHLSGTSEEASKSRFSYVGTVAKNLLLGAGVSLVMTPGNLLTTLNYATGGLSTSGYDPEFLATVTENTGRQFGKEVDGSRIRFSSCPFKTYLEEMDKLQDIDPYGPNRTTPFKVKLTGLAVGCVAAPIFEEVLFRGVIQGGLFRSLPKMILSRVAPEKVELVDSTAVKVARVVITAGLFSAYHLMNRGILPDSYVTMQLVAAFLGGLGFGTLKETHGLSAAIGAHMGSNLLQSLPSLVAEC